MVYGKVKGGIDNERKLVHALGIPTDNKIEELKEYIYDDFEYKEFLMEPKEFFNLISTRQEIIEIHGLKIPQSKLRDPDNAVSILAEAEVIARLAPYFIIELEPDIKEFRPKRLDAKLEYKDQQILIEVAVVNERIEANVAHGGISLSGGKVKNVLLTKFKKQLNKGEHDPNIPIVIILCLQRTIDDYEVQNAIYGQVQFYWKKRTDTPQIVEQGNTRIENSFYEEENSDIVTTIAAYKRDCSKKDSLIGRLYHPPYQVNPRNPLNREIRLRIRDALFGDNENSDWKSLTKIEEINQEMAKRLHDNGIEDLGILAIASDEELEIKGFNSGELKKFQNDARRIISALSTGSIRFLKGIDNGTYKLLTEKGIYLITQILEKTDNPEGITPSKWDEIVKDGEAIMKE